jgi:hypothetical protein
VLCLDLGIRHVNDAEDLGSTHPRHLHSAHDNLLDSFMLTQNDQCRQKQLPNCDPISPPSRIESAIRHVGYFSPDPDKSANVGITNRNAVHRAPGWLAG